MSLTARSKDPIGDANKAVDDAVAESGRRGNLDPEDVLAEWIVDLRDQLAGAVADRARLCAAMVRCAEKLESFGNEEPAAVASHLRDTAHAYGGQ